MGIHTVQTNGVILVGFHQNLVLNFYTTTTTQCVLECLYKNNYGASGSCFYGR